MKSPVAEVAGKRIDWSGAVWIRRTIAANLDGRTFAPYAAACAA